MNFLKQTIKKNGLIQAYNESKFIGLFAVKVIKPFMEDTGELFMRSLIYIIRLCYYQAAEFAIKNKLYKVEGAQGEHKIISYLPELTYSNHWFGNHELSEAITNYLDDEERNY